MKSEKRVINISTNPSLSLLSSNLYVRSTYDDSQVNVMVSFVYILQKSAITTFSIIVDLHVVGMKHVGNSCHFKFSLKSELTSETH